MKVKIIVLITVIVINVGLFSGCTDSINEVVNPPKFTLTSQYKREAYEGADRVGYVDITVKNTGGKGSGTIYVKVTQGSNYWMKEQSVYLENDESTDLTFRFSEIEFWTTDPWDFTAWVE